MSPTSRFHGFQEQPKKVINGPRPSPLMINKGSLAIQKSSFSSSITKPHQQVKKPIIIYTHSPKVIHTKPQDFMALVQKLTGRFRPNKEVSGTSAPSVSLPDHQEASDNFESSLTDGSNTSIKQEKQWKQSAFDGDETSSTLKGAHDHDHDHGTCGKGAGANVQLGFADMPLFTPNSSDFLSPSRAVYRYSDSPYGILGSLISPSGLEFIKELPEY